MFFLNAYLQEAELIKALTQRAITEAITAIKKQLPTNIDLHDSDTVTEVQQIVTGYCFYILAI